MKTLSPQDVQAGGRRRSGKSVKTLKKMLKKAGLKASGKKAALTRRAKKARLMGGAENDPCTTSDGKPGRIENGACVPLMTRSDSTGSTDMEVDGGRRRRSRKSRGFRLY